MDVFNLPLKAMLYQSYLTKNKMVFKKLTVGKIASIDSCNTGLLQTLSLENNRVSAKQNKVKLNKVMYAFIHVLGSREM